MNCNFELIYMTVMHVAVKLEHLSGCLPRAFIAMHSISMLGNLDRLLTSLDCALCSERGHEQ
jgi:hypothetical protein